MKLYGKLGILPAIGLLGWFISTTFLDRLQNKRLDALEHATVSFTVRKSYTLPSGGGWFETNTTLDTNITVGLNIKTK